MGIASFLKSMVGGGGQSKGVRSTNQGFLCSLWHVFGDHAYDSCTRTARVAAANPIICFRIL